MFNYMRSRASSSNLPAITPTAPLLNERGPPNPGQTKLHVSPPPSISFKLRLLLYIFVFAFIFILYAGTNLAVREEPIQVMTNQRFTMMINTFKRHKTMKEAVQYYASCPYVGEIYIVWCEQERKPSKALMENYNARKMPTVSFIVHDSVSLNNRFKPLGDLPHHDAIFAVDDDIRVPCHELGLGFEAWRNNPNSIVGYIPRIHIRGSGGYLYYRCWWNVWWYGAYSMILTKAAFLNHKFLDLYTNKMPASIRKYVDDNRNCEDIAMQFLIANETNLGPVYIKGHLDDEGATGGISTQNFTNAGHMGARSDCLNDLVKIYGKNPLVKSHIIIDSAANGWTNAPSTWYEYISSDLWHIKSSK